MVWIELVCDGCNYNPFGSCYRRDSLKDLKMRAKLAGWKDINGSLYCPSCQQKLKEAMRNESVDCDKVTRSDKEDKYSYSVGYNEGYQDARDGCGYTPRF